MGSEVPAPVAGHVDAAAEGAENRTSPTKIRGKVPKRIHKAEREKMKREQLNDLFNELASALDMSQPNNGKASILCEATRLLKDLVGQIDSLKKENTSLLTETHYVTSEKDELSEENSVLESQIENLQSELEARVAQSKPDLNELPPELHQPELVPSFSGNSLSLSAADATPQQRPPAASAVFVVRLHQDMPAYPMTTSHVSKPHARYPTPTDLWPSQLLGEQARANNGVQSSGSI